MITIETMSNDHIFQIAELEKLCFSDPWSVNAFAYELNNPLSLWLVALDQNRVVGYIGSQTVLDEADIMNVAVLPEYRQNGVGFQLVTSLSDQLKGKSVKFLSLEVRISNLPAISLYKKLGFEQVGLRPNYYRHPKEDALIMRKEIS